MNNYKFSIITISFNAEYVIAQTIESVIQQDYSNMEYIIIDGKSTDNTIKIVEKYIPKIKEKNIEVKYISEKDKGISDAFNKGIKMSTGDIIGLINAGDGLISGALKNLNNAFNDKIDIVYGNTLFIDKKHNLKYLRRIPNNIDIKLIKYNGLIFTHQSAFVKSNLYKKCGLYDISFKYVMDTDLFIKFVNNNAVFKYLDKTIVYMTSDGISSHYSLNILKENIKISKKYGGYTTSKMYFNFLIGIPKRLIINLTKHFPIFFYFLIGKERLYNDQNIP